MSTILNFVIGFVTTAITVLAVIYVSNKLLKGGVASLGKEPLLKTVNG